MAADGLTREKEWADKLRNHVNEFNALVTKLENAGFVVGYRVTGIENRISKPVIRKSVNIIL